MASVIDPYWIELGSEIGRELCRSSRHILVLSGAHKKVLDDIGAVVKKEIGKRLEFFSTITVLNGEGSNNDKIHSLLNFIETKPNKTQYPNTRRYFLVKDMEGELEKSVSYKTTEGEIYPVDVGYFVEQKQEGDKRKNMFHRNQ